MRSVKLTPPAIKALRASGVGIIKTATRRVSVVQRLED